MQTPVGDSGWKTVHLLGGWFLSRNSRLGEVPGGVCGQANSERLAMVAGAREVGEGFRPGARGEPGLWPGPTGVPRSSPDQPYVRGWLAEQDGSPSQ